MAGIRELTVQIQVQRDSLENYKNLVEPGDEEDAATSLAHNTVSLVPTHTSNKKSNMPDATETFPETSQIEDGGEMAGSD